MPRTGLLAVLLFLPTIPCFAQVKVHVEAESRDAVGRQLVYEVREGIRRSKGLAYEEAESRSTIRLKITTLNPDTNPNSSTHTVYAVIFSLINVQDPDGLSFYYSSAVGDCGIRNVTSCASTVVAQTDQLAVDIKASSNK